MNPNWCLEARCGKLMGMPSLRDWYSVRFDDRAISLQVNPPDGAAWSEVIQWQRIIRICLQTGDWSESDVMYIFTDARAESYVIPTEADGGLALWSEILERKLFDADTAIKAATTTNKLFCHPFETRLLDAAPLSSPAQLPDLEGKTVVLTWDQIDADSLILHENTVIWREWTGWEVYARFEEIAIILKQKYGKRLIDIEPTPRSLYALYGDSIAGSFRVEHVRESLRREPRDEDER
ncbi:MAG: hypothetical protein HC933_04145 [Pleurocapsa sp. SU_196_0]|nr:hypothetical protein [Pleurocapsa sp. SU_196_0]